MSATITIIERATVARINRAHHACAKAYADALVHALDAGRLLLDVKAELRHGEWGPWLGEHFEGSARVAQTYMQLAASPEVANTQSSAHLSIDQALKQLSRPRTPARIPRDELDELLAGQDLGEGAPEGAPPAGADAEASTERRARRLRRARELWREVGARLDELERSELSDWSRREQASSAGVKARHLIAALDELALSFEQ